MVLLSKTVCGIFNFQFRLVFMKIYIFVQQKVWTVWLQKVIIPFKIKITEKPQTVLLPDLWFLSCNKTFKIQWYLPELELPRNRPGDELFKLRKSKFWVHHFFSTVTFTKKVDVPLLKRTLKEHRCKFKINKIIYSKPQCIKLPKISLQFVPPHTYTSHIWLRTCRFLKFKFVTRY